MTAARPVIPTARPVIPAIHVYGGDFFDPPEPRSEWDHETLQERPWDIDNVRSLFQQAEARSRAVI